MHVPKWYLVRVSGLCPIDVTCLSRSRDWMWSRCHSIKWIATYRVSWEAAVNDVATVALIVFLLQECSVLRVVILLVCTWTWINHNHNSSRRVSYKWSRCLYIGPSPAHHHHFTSTSMYSKQLICNLVISGPHKPIQLTPCTRLASYPIQALDTLIRVWIRRIQWSPGPATKSACVSKGQLFKCGPLRPYAWAIRLLQSSV